MTTAIAPKRRTKLVAVSNAQSSRPVWHDSDVLDAFTSKWVCSPERRFDSSEFTVFPEKRAALGCWGMYLGKAEAFSVDFAADFHVVQPTTLLATVVQQFVARAWIGAAVDGRFEQLQDQITQLANSQLAIRQEAERRAKQSQVVARLGEHLTMIKDLCCQAFGGLAPQVRLEPLTDPFADFLVKVILDLSEHDSDQTTNARANGAREQFYRLLIRALPQDIFDGTDFVLQF
ncbi:MAG TPA: hypothetical protein VGM20_11040 [Gemmatimonadales bacterium]|jgi:hypothetical protein